MTRRIGPVVVLLLAVGGCLPEDGSLATVSAGLTDEAPQNAPPGRLLHAPASEEAAKRVLQVGSQILTSNPTLGVRPVFTTIGAPSEEIFHQDDKAVFITEGLVCECRTDGQLAAVLCHELGKMTAERQERAGPPPDHGPPMDAPVGTDYGGAFGPPDGTFAMGSPSTNGSAARRRKRPPRRPTPTPSPSPFSKRPAAIRPTSRTPPRSSAPPTSIWPSRSKWRNRWLVVGGWRRLRV